MRIVNALRDATRQSSRSGDPWRSGEPSLCDVMGDPVVHLLMRRDGLSPADVWPLLERVRAGLASRSHDLAA